MPKILLIEDEEPLRDGFSIILSTLPYEYDFASNGKIALEKCHNTTYDLIFLDLMMPVIDGIGFLKEFTKSSNDTRIIIMSNLSTSNLHDEAVKLGIHKSILKSEISPKQLISIIKTELNLRESQK